MRDIQRVYVVQDTHSGVATFCTLYIEISDKLSTRQLIKPTLIALEYINSLMMASKESRNMQEEILCICCVYIPAQLRLVS
jgi:hypothetical protein